MREEEGALTEKGRLRKAATFQFNCGAGTMGAALPLWLLMRLVQEVQPTELVMPPSLLLRLAELFQTRDKAAALMFALLMPVRLFTGVDAEMTESIHHGQWSADTGGATGSLFAINGDYVGCIDGIYDSSIIEVGFNWKNS